jgi:hypothetical protein
MYVHFVYIDGIAQQDLPKEFDVSVGAYRSEYFHDI